MRFQAFACECGYNLATAKNAPKCPDCGKDMVLMKKESKQYKKFNTGLKQLFR
jgi:predicted RNA-binding Zn-ribbon protein involved in translation (DUF1610 family)